MSNVKSNVNVRDEKLSEETRRLIDEAVARGEVQTVQPAAASGNEIGRGTRELIAKQRREFRKANKT